MSRIISLTTTNYKRARRVEIKPDATGALVIVSGNNGEGKSSVLDSIAAALGGVNAKATPRPIRDGESKAEIVLETEDLTVTRTFTGAGSRLAVQSKDGATFSKGQAKLDELVGKLAMDPLAFTQLSDRDQVAQLLALVDLPFDPAELDDQRKTLFDRRADIGRQGKAIGDFTVDASLPSEETSASEIIAEIRQAEADGRARAEWENGIRLAEGKVTEIREQIETLTAELANWEATLKTRRAGQADLPPVQDTAPLEARLAAVEETNAAIRTNNQARAKEENRIRLLAEYDALSQDLSALDAQKRDGLAAAEFPVDGLGFDESGVTYQGVPFKQASSAEQIRVSLAMAIALNPGLRVIRIADGSLLDANSLALIKEQAEAHDFQIWIEMVGPREDGYVIEDGELAK